MRSIFWARKIRFGTKIWVSRRYESHPAAKRAKISLHAVLMPFPRISLACKLYGTLFVFLMSHCVPGKNGQENRFVGNHHFLSWTEFLSLNASPLHRVQFFCLYSTSIGTIGVWFKYLRAPYISLQNDIQLSTFMQKLRGWPRHLQLKIRKKSPPRLGEDISS